MAGAERGLPGHHPAPRERSVAAHPAGAPSAADEVPGDYRPRVLHQTYLPFTADQLEACFLHTAGCERGVKDKHLAHYLLSIEARLRYERERAGLPRKELRRATARGRQMEKDERFWVASCLMHYYYSSQRTQLFAALLQQLFPKPPVNHSTWGAALGRDLQLFFEVNLPSPQSYRDHLRRNLDERILVRYMREAAANSALEGATKVDAVVMAPDTGVAVLFEAKVLSDVSGGVEYDVLRNQLARNIDVMLEPPAANAHTVLSRRDPALTYFVLLTPAVFRTNWSSRLYGWLLRDYQRDVRRLADHLPHRCASGAPAPELHSVTSRLGWTTWEECNDVAPGACPWLPVRAEPATCCLPCR